MFKISEGDKEAILGMYAKGLTTEEIKEKFHDKYKGQQLAAIKAWKTMRTRPGIYTRKEALSLFKVFPGTNLNEGSGGPTYCLDSLREHISDPAPANSLIDMHKTLSGFSWDQEDETRFWNRLRKAICCPFSVLPIFILNLVKLEKPLKYFHEIIVPIIEWRLKKGR